MKAFEKALLGVSMAAAACGWLAAQEMNGPPKVLEIQREFLKPGRAGMIHDRSESNFVKAMANAKWPTHYFALNSLSGKSRALYMVGYASFADWQKDNDATEKNAALSGEIDRAAMSDGDLLTEFDQAVLYLQPELSLNVNNTDGLAHTKYMEVTSFHLRPGHHSDWTELVKMVIDGHKKGGTNANWAMFELEYGGGDQYILFSRDKDMSEIDEGFAEGKKFRDAMGEDGMKKLDSLAAACIESSDSELFAINPRQSYPPDEWVKANPEFWKPKPVVAATKPGAEKAKPMARKPAGQ